LEQPGENVRFLSTNKAVSILGAMIVLVGATAGQNKHCTAAGGMLMTNLGAFDPAPTQHPPGGADIVLTYGGSVSRGGEDAIDI